MPTDAASFASLLIAWQRRHGRRDLPWQRTREPYRIWLSEIMLQQTQVSTVIPYYERFLRRFPDVFSLAAASEDEVLRHWSGLGYYARGRNLHRASRLIVSRHQGIFPAQARELEQLPGIGRSTAAAIAGFAFGERAAILDGNVKRVLARCHGIEGWPGDPKVLARLWALAERLLPPRSIGAYSQALMDLGATLCTRAKPRCGACPVRARCIARKANRASAIPAPRPRKTLPVKTATWLVLRRSGSVLLERRPRAGVWGGLWGFPELEGKRIARDCSVRLGCEIASSTRLAPFVHSFTHFRLAVRPHLCEVKSVSPRAEQAGRLWLPTTDALEAAVPAPVRKLLQALV